MDENASDLYLQADNAVKVYVNGEYKGFATDWTRTLRIPITGDDSVIAAQLENTVNLARCWVIY